MANITTTEDVGPGTDVYYDKQLLARAMPKRIHMLPAQRKKLPSRTSDSIKFRRQVNLAPSTTPLSEGVTPAGKKLSVVNIVAEVKQYGDYITITDKVQYVVESPTLNDNAKLLGQQMGETLDQVTMEELESTASVYECEFGSNGNAITELTYDDMAVVEETLLNASGEFFTPVLEAGEGQGTVPVGEAFWAMGHTKLMKDIRAISSFIPKKSYPDPKQALDAEIGATDNIRWLLSPLGSRDTSQDPDIYNVFVVAQDAYGVIDLDEGNVEHIFKEFGSGGTADPLNQRATQGWKAMFTARVLNQNWIRKVKCTRS